MNGFGCARCIPDPPQKPSALPLRRVAALIDEPHFIVSIRACTACGQQFVSIFTERIDWKHGEDPQCSTLLPLTPDEAKAAVAAGEEVDLRALERLALSRPFLRDDWPDGPRTLAHLCGVLIGPHD